MAASDPPALSELKIKDLKTVIEAGALEHKDCLDRADLERRASEAVAQAERAARVKAAADAAEQKLRAEEEQEKELEKLANALGGRPRRHCGGSRPISPFPHRQQAARQGQEAEEEAEAPAAAAAVQGGLQGEQRRQGRRGRLQDQEGQEVE